MGLAAWRMDGFGLGWVKGGEWWRVEETVGWGRWAVGGGWRGGGLKVGGRRGKVEWLKMKGFGWVVGGEWRGEWMVVGGVGGWRVGCG